MDISTSATLVFKDNTLEWQRFTECQVSEWKRALSVKGTRAVSHSFLRSNNIGREVYLCFTELVAQATWLGRNRMNGMHLQSLHFDLQATLSGTN